MSKMNSSAKAVPTEESVFANIFNTINSTNFAKVSLKDIEYLNAEEVKTIIEEAGKKSYSIKLDIFGTKFIIYVLNKGVKKHRTIEIYKYISVSETTKVIDTDLILTKKGYEDLVFCMSKGLYLDICTYKKYETEDYKIEISADPDVSVSGGSWVEVFDKNNDYNIVFEGDGPDDWYDEDGKLIATDEDFERYASSLTESFIYEGV